ncbi:MAG: lamin tail domain-containing protein [Candidatus Pacebacteria bacterium]|nr:lamin tail domain-containing protein [Candidatus Paceibacterota bacterium]
MKNANQKILSVCKFLFIFLLFISTAQKARASIVFSEIAWMGGLNSSADEWIEIYNDGSDVNLEGYLIESESKKISINLNGTIAGNSYYLIERTDDNSVQNIIADLTSTFGTGLNNAGDNLYLKNNTGQVIDSLTFSGGWPAGDNTTKQTMQLVSNSWLTAEPTPKSAPVGAAPSGNQTNNSNSEDVQNSNQTASSGTSQVSQKTGGSSYVAPKNLSRFIITIGDDQFSQIPLTIEIDYRDDYGNKPYYGFYRVNFGDGVQADFKLSDPVSHVYEYKGDYKISVKFMDSAWSLLPKKQASVNVSVTEPLIEIVTKHAPVLVVKNMTTKDLDLGNFSFIAQDKIFNPPQGSIVFSGKEVWISPKITNFSIDDINNLKVVSKSDQAVIYTNIYTNENSNSVAKQPTSLVKQKNTSVVTKALTNNTENILSNLNQKNLNSENLIASSGSSTFSEKQKPNNLIIWFLFGALIIAGSIVFIKLRRVEVNEANDFSLLEE